jgi:GntR family transcriptional regulator
MPLDRSSPVPLWAQVLEDLRERIANGELDDRFPTDQELMAHYGVSRHTARDAARRLASEGLIVRERGRGSMLRRAAFEQPLGSLYSLFQSIEGQGAEQTSVVRTLEVRVDEHAAKRLERSADCPLVHLERVRLAAGQPLAVDRVWLPADVAGPLLGADFTHTALYAELAARCGVRVDAARESIAPVLPDRTERQLLELPARQPCFAIDRRGWWRGGLVEWRRTLIRGDRFRFVADWSSARDSAPSFGVTPAPGLP